MRPLSRASPDPPQLAPEACKRVLSIVAAHAGGAQTQAERKHVARTTLERDLR